MSMLHHLILSSFVVLFTCFEKRHKRNDLSKQADS